MLNETPRYLWQIKKPPEGGFFIDANIYFFAGAGALAVDAVLLTTFGAHVPPLWCFPVPPVKVSPFGQAIADAVAKPNATTKINDNNFFMI